MRLPFVLCALISLLAPSDGAVAQDKQTDKPTLKSGEFVVQLNGLELWYKVSGKGPVCLMPTPAWGPSSDSYFRTLKPLEKHFTIVYLDSRGTTLARASRSPAITP